MYTVSLQMQQQNVNQRLVNAAATEKYSTNKKLSAEQYREINDRDEYFTEEREMNDDTSSNEDLLVRCNITVVTNSCESIAEDTPSVGTPRQLSKKSSSGRVRRIRKKSKKSVRFHKYDEVIYLDVTEYIYSLHNLEVEHERNSRDLVDDIEGVVGDVGYFLKCLKEGIQEEAAKSLGDRRGTVRH